MVHNFNPQTSKYIEAKKSLPEDLQSIFEELVDQYCFYSLKSYGRAFVSYDILANIVKEGWRPKKAPANKGNK